MSIMCTPGPWTAKQLHNSNRWVILWTSKMSGIHMRRLDSGGEFMEDDARLLAAAPELLAAALKLEARGFFNAVSCADTETLADMAAMRSAIAKIAS